MTDPRAPGPPTCDIPNATPFLLFRSTFLNPLTHVRPIRHRLFHPSR